MRNLRMVFIGIEKVRLCLQLEDDESNISRLSIIKEDVYKAWYPFKKKGKEYRIGYAESIDGINWERKDDLGKT